MRLLHPFRLALQIALLLAVAAPATGPAQVVGSWVKQTPVAGAPVSPRLGYEGACVWDSKHGVLIRYGGHNQGGGGEQGSEVWTFDPSASAWALKEPNSSPPGVCCNAQNVFAPAIGRYVRFPSFSGNHGWQWWRELYLNDSTVWTYDLAANNWLNRRPLPAPRVAGLRCAAWDSDASVAVVFGGEGGPKETLVYSPHRNEWRSMKPPWQPEPRSGGQMAYDAARKVHVLFGSQFTDDPHTWIYDLARNEWRDARPPSLPPTDKNDAVLAYDSARRVVVAIVKITTGEDENAQHRLETWTYDAGANQWSRLGPAQEPEPSGNRARQLVFAPELGVSLLESCPSQPREQQIWTLRLAETAPQRAPAAAAPAEPAIVEHVVVSVLSADRVELEWKPVADPGLSGYHVERAVVEVATEDQLTRLKRQTPPLDPPSVGAFRRIGAFRRLTPAPVDATTFTDTAANLASPRAIDGEAIHERKLDGEELDESGRAYRLAVLAYRIRAVNAAGVESGPSPACFTIPSSPQWVFSREEGATCGLKWAANPEKGLQGYRVYRMDGRWDKDPISRLTPAPISGTAYSDPGAGKSSRRYYIVAVDALGQEGLPSSPVWFEREWKQYYKPFTSEWHQ